MRFTSLLGVAALFAPCALAAFDPVEAYEMLYYYTIYDLDVSVWGPKNGYVAPACSGSGDNGRCRFNEFVNFIAFGDAANSPSYYDMGSGYSMAPGDVMVIVGTLMDKFETAPAAFSRLIRGRRSAIGVWNDLGFAMDKGAVEGAAKDISISRQLKNAELVLGAVKDVRASILNSEIRKQLISRVKDAVWQTVEQESQFVQKPWQEIEWEKTVAAYPDMANPESQLFKQVTEALNDFYTDKQNAKGLTIQQKIGKTLAGCFR